VAPNPATDARVNALEETVEKLQDLLRKSNQELAESDAMHHGGDVSNGTSDAGGSRGGGADELRRLRQTERELRAQLSAVIREKETELLALADRWEARIAAEQVSVRGKKCAAHARTHTCTHTHTHTHTH
jgi:hypothetical protein